MTENLRGKLEALARVQELASRGQVSSALLPAIEGWVEGLDVAWSKDVQRRRDALAAARLPSPLVPRALAAELRDYQKDGFVFRRLGAPTRGWGLLGPTTWASARQCKRWRS